MTIPLRQSTGCRRDTSLLSRIKVIVPLAGLSRRLLCRSRCSRLSTIWHLCDFQSRNALIVPPMQPDAKVALWPAAMSSPSKMACKLKLTILMKQRTANAETKKIKESLSRLIRMGRQKIVKISHIISSNMAQSASPYQRTTIVGSSTKVVSFPPPTTAHCSRITAQ